MNNIGIYKITNKFDNKIYIGQTVNYRKRKSSHFSYLKNGKHHNEHLQRAFNKYGESSFEITFIKSCKVNELDELETEYIKTFKCVEPKFGYNMMTGGQIYRKFTDEVKLKMSVSAKGRVFTKIHKSRISSAQKGKIIKPESIVKLKATLLARRVGCGEKNPNASISDDMAEKIIFDLLDNMTVSDIANKYQVSKDVVYNLMYGRSFVHILPELREQLSKRTKSLNSSKIEEAVDLYLQGNSQNFVSKQLGISRNTLRRELKERDIETNKTSNQYKVCQYRGKLEG